ncbi:hypothetical protein PITCH_A690005 [uncultured Desulfobacterium sp.]|uniref:Uncharacterized protein n=1 Tax=uncultured Desulfobacterium sp. TaxID=201089 RepID=A0A445N1P7_9BACT|nr:hypothetical protein PITCH_A690005 [uncultured Desulfobacterium sp.]
MTNRRNKTLRADPKETFLKLIISPQVFGLRPSKERREAEIPPSNETGSDPEKAFTY